jgi:putative tryptophan/tyrosine transport system substrate-binding protein
MWGTGAQGSQGRRRYRRAAFSSLFAMAAAAAALVGCGSSGSAAKSSTPAIRQVGLMHVGTDHVPPSLKPLKARLARLGWVQGRTINLIWRNLPDEDAADRQAREFVHEHVDMIVAFEDQSIRAAQAATKESRIPVVFVHPADPVASGYVRSLAHPGGNLTGVFGLRDLVQKQLELYKLLVPRLHRVLALVDPLDPSTPLLWAETDLAAPKLQLKLVERQVTGAAGIGRVFRSLRPGRVDGVFVVSPKILFNFTTVLLRDARSARLPVEANRKEWVQRGAFFAYGPDFQLLGSKAARYVDEILRGVRPSQLAVEYVPQVKLAINLTTARALGLVVPESMIVRADYVYR